jgi:HSP20 family protein
LKARTDEVSRELTALRERMTRLFDDDAPAPGDAAGAAWIPVADVYRRGDVVVITLEVPGVAEETIEVVASSRSLKVHGWRRPISEVSCALQLERSYGRFARTFALPAGARVRDRRLSLGEGVLRIEIPIG